MYANLLTGIATSEGLMRSMAPAERLGAWSGVPIESAMLSDIPGFTWGLVPALAQHGVRYLSIGPNFGHRIGYFSQALGDRPFYWESPSGRERLLTWVSGAGYATFHSGLGYSKLTKALDEVSVFKYVEQLAQQGYPYDMTYLRYNIGSDNGPPDPDLSDAVRAWNERYVSPRLVISNVTDVFKTFEERYGDRLPVHRGDLTGHWEDGAASSARETAHVRRVAEQLIQTEALAAMLSAPLPPDEVYAAWRSVVLYYEHTWGSWNSVSEPLSEFTLSQWEHKKAFADSAAARAARLRDRVLAGRVARSSSAAAVDVINTASWPRTDLVVLSPAASRRGDWVVDESGRRVPSQRLSTGELAFLAEDVAAFGARRFLIEPGAVDAAPSPDLPDNVIANDDTRVEIDTLRGTIGSLVYRPAARELVGDALGLNQYIYVAGRDPADAATAGGAVTVTLKERGPLVSCLEVVAASAPGATSGVRSEVRLYTGLDRVDIINTIDKALVYDPEAVLYRYPFDIADPVVRIDVPWGSFRLEDEQLPGSSKNYLSLQRWTAVQGADVGVTFASIDAPLIQFGAIRTDAIVAGWLQHIEPSATLFSYAMNNYWETNYKAAQDGPHEFRYSLRPHRTFDEADAERFARGIAQPLIAVPVERDAPRVESPFAVEARRAVVTSLQLAADGSGFVVRLYNPGDQTDVVALRRLDGVPLLLHRADVRGTALEPLESPLELDPYQILTLRVTRN
jgi:alpha-mannosidase